MAGNLLAANAPKYLTAIEALKLSRAVAVSTHLWEVTWDTAETDEECQDGCEEEELLEVVPHSSRHFLFTY